MKIHFIRHIFTTLTYEHSINEQVAWQRVSKDYNRYVQKLRRLHVCPVQYLRTVEKHKENDYPHVHTLLQFPDARIRVENDRYFTRPLFQKWKSTWPHGLSDYQVPRTNGTSQLSYILKYITKNATSKTIWKRILSNSSANSAEEQPTVNQDGSPQELESTSSASLANDIMDKLDSKAPVHYQGVKLCSWSRGFDFTPFFNKTLN